MSIIPDRRTALLDVLADHVLAHGLAAASLRPLAKAAGTSDRMLLYYFKDKADLTAAVLETIAARIAAILAPPEAIHPKPFETVRRDLTTTLLDASLWPYMRLWLELASRAANGDPLARETGEAIARAFLTLAASLLDTPAPALDATRLLIAIEGAVLLKSLGLEAEVRAAL